MRKFKITILTFIFLFIGIFSISAAFNEIFAGNGFNWKFFLFAIGSLLVTIPAANSLDRFFTNWSNKKTWWHYNRNFSKILALLKKEPFNREEFDRLWKLINEYQNNHKK